MTSVRSFGRYRVTGTLGTGAMGEVYCAVDEVLGREVAVKTLRSHATGLAARLLDARFRQEARAIASLHHAGVVQVFDIDLAAEPPYLVMERVAGPSLKERLAHGPLVASELRTLGIQIARALAAAHAAGVVHRDVKPANILAAGPGAWKLADFGVAHIPDSSLTLTGQFVGSPAYAPPEALVRGVSAAAGDIYGLGATLYEAAAGRWPRIEDTSSALLAPLPPLAGLAPALPPDVAAAIDRAVAIDPAQRPSAAELADALAGASSFASHASDAGPHAGPPPAASSLASLVAPPAASSLVSLVAPPAASSLASHAGAPHAASSLASLVAQAGPPPAASFVAHAGAPPAAVLPPAPSSLASHAVVPPAHAATAAAPPPADSSLASLAVSLPAGAAPALRWKPWAIAAAGLVALLLVATTRGAAPPPSPRPAAEPVPPTAAPTAVTAPPGMNGKQTKDWNKIFDELDKGHHEGARHKLDEFEDRYGETDETRALRPQLDALGPDQPRGPGPPRGRGKKHHDD